MISDKNTLDLNLLCFFEHDIDHPQQKRNMNIRIFPPNEKMEDWMFFVSNAKNRPFVTWDLFSPPHLPSGSRAPKWSCWVVSSGLVVESNLGG